MANVTLSNPIGETALRNSPKSFNKVRTKVKTLLLIRPGEYPEGLIVPLGLLYLASYIEQKLPDIKIEVLDAALYDYSAEDLARMVKDHNAEIVGLTGLTVHAPFMREAANAIKQLNPNTIIVAGGPSISSDHSGVMSGCGIDIGVVGEGEETFLDLINAIQEGRDFETVDGMAYKDEEGRIRLNRPRGPILDLDAIPFPAYHKIKVEDYFNSDKRISQSPVYISKKLLPVFTSRGCPWKCIFCHNGFGKTFRYRSPENVMQELKMLKDRYDFQELEIIDDIFNYNKKRDKALFQKIIDEDMGLKIAFPNGIKYEMVDDEALDLYKKAGVYRIAFGIESGNHEMQKVVGKPIKIPRIKKIIDSAADKGFFVSGFFQLGLPKETQAQMQETIDFACSTKLHTAMFHITIPFPGTRLHEEYIKNKLESDNFRSARDISVNLSGVDDKMLINLKQKAFVRFYFNPKRIINTFRVFPIKSRLFKNFINVISEILFRRWIIPT